jgi:ATP-dependent DNA helicase RecG
VRVIADFFFTAKTSLIAKSVLFLYDLDMLKWDDSLSFLHHLTTRERKALAALNVETIGALLSILPRRYEDYSHLVPIAQLKNGVPVTIQGHITEIAPVKTFRTRFSIIRAIVSDDSGSIAVTWFNQPWLLKRLTKGTEIYLSGTVTQRPRFGRGFTSPLWEPATEETLAAGMVAPVYPLVSGLTQKTFRKAVKAALGEVEFPSEWIPDEIRSDAHVVDLPAAYRHIHYPDEIEQAEVARRRFAFGELLGYQLALRMAREEADTRGAPKISFDQGFAKTFVASLPFELTEDQKKAVWGCVKDMEEGRPMRRLLQGDVGSGKTVVAAMLSALVFRSGASSALMAPTDLLAKQHAETLRRFLTPHQIPVLLLTSSTRILFEGGEEKKLSSSEAKERFAQGRIVGVGTHALIEHGQAPADLALAIVDEQHRFGVSQREALVVSVRSDGLVPHFLSMSATPIPRSLALTFHGDLDISIIHAKPAGRAPIKTEVGVGEMGREMAYDRIRSEIVQGNRAFVVCPLIDPSDVLGVKSVEEEARRLSNGPLRGYRLVVLHGKMANKDKDEVMHQFASGKLDVLIATTVVEVGVDVPEATVMVIEGAERFGLAQLHQLRGRVGRSSRPSFCILIATDDDVSLRRLKVLERTNDGFVVAEEDLKIRGEGNLLGLQQSGETAFACVRYEDVDLMSKARDWAIKLLKQGPQLDHVPSIKQEVERLRMTSHRE